MVKLMMNSHVASMCGCLVNVSNAMSWLMSVHVGWKVNPWSADMVSDVASVVLVGGRGWGTDTAACSFVHRDLTVLLKCGEYFMAQTNLLWCIPTSWGPFFIFCPFICAWVCLWFEPPGLAGSTTLPLVGRCSPCKLHVQQNEAGPS